MGIVKAAIETYASDGSLSSRKFVNTVIAAQINKDSERAVDTAQFTFPAQTPVDIGNGILYIQDIVDTGFLRGIWNFQYSLKDESGNALDGTSSNEAVSKYGKDGTLTDVPNALFTGTICRGLASSGDSISVTNSSLIDFSGQFDVTMWFTCRTSADSNTNPKYLLDKLDGGTQGISIYTSSGTSQVLTVDMWNTVNGLTNITGTRIVNDENWHFLRLVRTADNNIKLYLDGIQEGTTATTADSFSNTSNLIFGDNPSATVNTRNLYGYLLQIRLYCGGTLSDSDAGIVYSYKPQPYTMKFGGIVWQINDNTDSKVVSCKSFAQVLGNIELTFDNLTTTTGSPPASPYIANNVYEGKKCDQIISDFVTNVLSGWTLMFVPTTGTAIARYVASGNLLSNIFYLLMTESGGSNGGNLTFFTTARKVIIVENVGVDHTTAPGAITFKGVQVGGKYDITNDGTDDTIYTNSVTVSAGKAVAVFHETATPANLAVRSSVLQFSPISATVQVPAGTYLKMDNSASPGANTFQIDTENKQIVFSTAFNGSTAYVVDYTYEDTANLYWNNQDSTGITQNGQYSRNYNVPQFKDFFSVRLFAANIITKFGNSVNHVIPQRIRINAPVLVNNVRENFKITVVSGVKGINSSYIIKQIVWKYPDGTTQIEAGDFLYDMYDLDNSTTSTVVQNTQTYTVTKNVTKSSS